MILTVGLPSTVLAGMTSPSRRHDHKPKGDFWPKKNHGPDKNYWPGKDHWFDKKHWPDDDKKKDSHHYDRLWW